MIHYSLLSTALSKHWNISPAKKQLLQEREGQEVFLISSEAGKFIVKIYSSGTSLAQVSDNAGIVALVNRLNYPSPKQIATSSGSFLTDVDNRYLTVQEYLEGNTPLVSKTTYNQLGTMVGMLHTLDNHGAPKANIEMDAGRLKKELSRKGERYGADLSYFRLVNELPDFSKLPASIIHTDLELRNVIQLHDGSLALIDWDDSGVGTSLLDLAYCVVSLLSESDGLNVPCAKAFYDSYTEYRPITQEELRLFEHAVTYWLLCYMYIDGIGLIESNRKKLIYWKKHGPLLKTLIFS